MFLINKHPQHPRKIYPRKLTWRAWASTSSLDSCECSMSLRARSRSSRAPASSASHTFSLLAASTRLSLLRFSSSCVCFSCSFVCSSSSLARCSSTARPSSPGPPLTPARASPKTSSTRSDSAPGQLFWKRNIEVVIVVRVGRMVFKILVFLTNYIEMYYCLIYN